jgi:hypothetical protein
MENSSVDYKQKYLKYKRKYLELKAQLGGIGTPYAGKCHAINSMGKKDCQCPQYVSEEGKPFVCKNCHHIFAKHFPQD